MRFTVKLLLCSLSLAAPAIHAEESTTAPPAAPAAASARVADARNVLIDLPSPSGEFAFRKTYGEYRHTLELIDKKSGKTLQKFDDEDSSTVTWEALWSGDSKRFALMTRLGHHIQAVDVYFRSGDTFRQVEIPDLSADIPERLTRHKKFPHFASLNQQVAEAWQSDGSLVISIDTTMDGAGNTVWARRKAVLAFDHAGKAKVVKSTIKYGSE